MGSDTIINNSHADVYDRTLHGAVLNCMHCLRSYGLTNNDIKIGFSEANEEPKVILLKSQSEGCAILASSNQVTPPTKSGNAHHTSTPSSF